MLQVFLKGCEIMIILSDFDRMSFFAIYENFANFIHHGDFITIFL